MPLTDRQIELCSTSTWDFSDLRALFVNCTLKPSPELSHTEGLMRISMEIMSRNGVSVDAIRAVDHDLAPGVYPDMTEHGAASRRLAGALRARPGGRHPRARLADLARREVVRLHARDRAAVRQLERSSTSTGQYAYYGKVGGCLITGQRGRRQALRDEHPLLAAAPRVHDPAAGRRRLDRRGGARPVLPRRGLGRSRQRLHEPQHDVHDLEPPPPRAAPEGRRRHPAHGNQRSLWDAGCRFDFPNPEYR